MTNDIYQIIIYFDHIPLYQISEFTFKKKHGQEQTRTQAQGSKFIVLLGSHEETLIV